MSDQQIMDALRTVELIDELLTDSDTDDDLTWIFDTALTA